ncbi:malonic semialdehyde reductase [Komagataeibacter nataicola]|uniref:Malonic semialdehyde reductase n=1 Tax=Komagataeibacter nataicola TaxID=265960 RepID=A0A9N7CNE3_9PROT|nr:malonic semialdehyde reductase [Komagataeibacter nataicola]AQU87724.1 malonic semialdehyde reductase [Komagataeibacter nataicola]PYD65670.1 malonic semialdehyde reductase [Komagataeibacter nataicola]WEQ55465.1 malonic semialdehyde reductase [Komagataeibacter nataicola]WNM09672.1 malonic semialdehyde reductase [Komagataeibacter nataicola]GBR19968.1 NADH dehydrogenase [Komagataeibacter nataicola NRIC 0616]
MALDDAGLDLLFRNARTPVAWNDRPVGTDTLRQLYDLVRLGPTSGNCCPARFVFLTTEAARERLRPALSAGNVQRMMTAPVTVIVAHDPLFFERMDTLNPQAHVRQWFAADVGLAEETAQRNGTLEGGYMILAARALGLSALPLSGFDAAMVEEAFLANQGWQANFLLCLGYCDGPPPEPRAPRLGFDDACVIV